MSRFFSDIGQTGYYGNLTQYYDSYAYIQNYAEADGNWQDVRTYPTSTVYDTDIQNEVKRAISQNNWPNDSIRQFNIFLGTNASGGPEVLCSGPNSGNPRNCTSNSYMCAYHNSLSVWSPALAQWIVIAYTAIPYGQGYGGGCKPPVTNCPNGSGCNVDTALQWLSHETFETTNDPYGGANAAWQDRYFSEIGDKCQAANHFSGIVNDSYNHLFNGHQYILQDEWNNAYAAGGTGGNCSPYGPTFP